MLAEVPTQWPDFFLNLGHQKLCHKNTTAISSSSMLAFAPVPNIQLSPGEREREIERDRFGNPQHLGALVPVVPFRFSGSWGCSSRNFGGLRPDSGGPDGATSRYQQILWGFESASAQKWGKSLTEKKSNKMLRYVDGNRWKLWKMKQHYPKVETT